MDVQHVDAGRRGFLARLVAAGVVSAVGYAAAVKPARAAPPPGTADPYGVDVLREPIVLGDRESLVDRAFVLSPQFNGMGTNSIIRVAGHGVRIRNVRIFGADRWDPRWGDLSQAAKSRRGVFGNTVGIRIEKVRDVAVEQVSIEGLPRPGIAGYGITGGTFRDISIRHCYAGINLLYYQPNTNLVFQRVHVSDTWGAKQDRSRARPGQFIGGGAFALNSLRDSTLMDCVAVGEMTGAFKMTNPHRVTARGLRGCGLQVQGVAAGAAGAKMVPARDVLIQDCVFDKGLGWGATVQGANCMQITMNVDSARIQSCLLSAAGAGGHGIQVTVDSHAYIEGCTIRGFNQIRGTGPAFALDVARGSTANSNFSAVNTFVDQKRLVQDRT